jgi:cellulose synthase/poly-beta-1,6-N-acetylglucosamine synthase-like glycosyltransferase
LKDDHSPGPRVSLAAAGASIVLGAWFNWRVWRRDQDKGDQSQVDLLPPLDEWPSRPRVSVLVAAWNESKTIERVIRSFMLLRYEPKQLILCAGGQDGTYEIARGWTGRQVTVLEQRRGEGKQRSLRRCLELAGGEIVVLTDADCALSNDSFERLVYPLTHMEVAATTGFTEPWPEQRDNVLAQYQWFEGRDREQRTPVRVHGVLGGNCAIRRDTLEQLQPFGVRAETGTDYVLSRVIVNRGKAIVSVPASRVRTRYPVTVSSYLRMRRRWIKNILIHAPRFGAWADFSTTVGAIGIAAAILLTPLLAAIGGRRVLILPLTLIALASENRIRRVALGAHLAGVRPRFAVVAASPVLVVLDQSAVLLALFDTVNPSRRLKW